MISRSGVRGLRVEQVAAEAKVSPPLLYYHFASRQGLIRAALERASERAPSAALREAPERGEAGYAALRAALLAEFDEDREVRDNAVVWGEVTASAVFDPELRDDVRRVGATWTAEVSDAVRRGIEDSSIRPDVDPDRAGQILTALVDGLCNRWLAGGIDREAARSLLDGALQQTLRPEKG
ncbi:MAG: TetR/AcrR family transcriptional regulator [Actinomycetota bacterium]|nr:TetR/AcrR family transcriptional regulator [Actinomycetota bacterium]